MSQGITSVHVRNLDDNGANVSNGVCHIAKILVVNTTAAAAFIQVFDRPVSAVTIGTTVPMFVIPVVATSGFQFIDFNEPGLYFTNRCSMFSTTAAEGATGSDDGVFVQCWVN